ncbi:MAG: GNAT family N-acetyltransferase [Chloroflexota bacterium]
MIKTLDFDETTLAKRALTIQKMAYGIEADLIGFDDIPQLHETINDLQSSPETFIGYFVDHVLAGVLSYDIEDNTLDIGRLVVHPDYFRRGIARALITHIDAIEGVSRWIVSTGAKNSPARHLYETFGYQLVEIVKLPVGVEIAHYEKYRVK